MSSTTGIEKVNKEGSSDPEVKVETIKTVDYRSPPGEDQKTTKNDIHVVHLTKKGADSGGGLAGAVVSGVQSAKEAVFGDAKDKTEPASK